LPLLEKWHIPYALDGGINALDQPVVRQLIQLCTVVVEQRQGSEISRPLLEVLSFPWFGLDRRLLFQLARLASRQQRPLIEVLCAEETRAEPAFTDAKTAQRLQKTIEIVSLMEKWAADDWSLPFEQWLEQVAVESGLRQWLLDHADTDLTPLLAYYSLFAFIRQVAVSQSSFHAADFVRSYQTMLEEQVAVPIQSPEPAQQRVTLSTVHGAKGQEWDYVFLTQVIDGVWGGQRSRASLPTPEAILSQASQASHACTPAELQEQEDRRLFYVALTRARRQVQIWYPSAIEQQGRVRPTTPSMFISEMAPQSDIQTESAVTNTTPSTLLATLTLPAASPDKELREYIQSITSDFVLSVTALNDYLRDPKLFLFRHILRLPEATQPTLAYGSAMHKALEAYGKMIIAKKVIDVELLQHVFQVSLEKQPISLEDKQRRLTRGMQVLREYLGQAPPTADIWKTEYTVGGGMQMAHLEGIRLKGRMDRLDWLDREKNSLCVIDYKTGKVRSKGELLATTQATQAQLSPREQSLGDTIRSTYLRQATFYRLLGTLHPTGMPSIDLARFEFIESPFEKGKPTSVQIPLTDSAVSDLTQLIHEVAAEIQSAAFLDQIEWSS
jgi:DNA helicase-2/ATP-dependent DNA helicase PcrA